MNKLQELLQRSAAAKAQAHTITLPTTNNTDTYEVKLNARVVISAPKDRVIVSCDYSAQEALVAAVVSGDARMLNTFSPDVPDKIPLNPAYLANFVSEYKDEPNYCDNPDKDLHTLSGMLTAPAVFQDRQRHEWCCIARDTKYSPDGKRTIRDIGKLINFASMYLMAEGALAAQNYVTEETAKQWLNAFKTAFPDYIKWAELTAAKGLARGWMVDGASRLRFCAEANSKGKDNSADRLAVNHCIQGLVT